MGILNVTPDSFSDGGKFASVDSAVKQAVRLVNEGADLLDIGGESTRPASERVSAQEEIRRVIPVIKAVVEMVDVPISIDTSKSEVAELAVSSGAEIINDISGLMFDERIAGVAADSGAGLVLMNLQGAFEEMHRPDPVANILKDVAEGFEKSIAAAKKFGIRDSQICLDPGIGFSKSFEQNLELIAKLDELIEHFRRYPMLIGVSRKSFIGRILGAQQADERINGTIAANAIACWKGVNIVRVHDVKQAVESLKLVDAIKREI